MTEDWDIESYKTEHENEDHWELRKNFMLAHKDKFSEDELVCLAQVFTNIEFMGCRYPDKTMIRVAELAKGVVEKFREQRKNSLKRTFVAASDAATAKVKGHTYTGEESGPPKKTNKMTFVGPKNESEFEANEKKKLVNSNVRISKYGGVKTFSISSNKRVGESEVNKPDGLLGDLVLILSSESDHPVSTIQRTAALNKCAIRWDIEEGKEVKTCRLFLKNECIAIGSGVTVKICKEMTALAGIEKLKESCYGIKMRPKFFSETTVSPSHLESRSQPQDAPCEELGEDNIGRKLLKLMGWQGGGLGTKGQGKEEPVAAALQMRRRDGLGLNANSSTVPKFKRKLREYIRMWMNGNSDQDLVFSSDFSSEERKAMHEVASSFSLKSKSYGKSANRQLVISRKPEPWEIVKELRKIGGKSDKYELLYPTKS